MNSQGPMRGNGRLAGSAVWLIAVCLFTASLCGGEPQARFFDQLRARQLYSLAERYCLEKLARPDLPAAQRIDFTYELSRTFVQHALVAGDDQQAELWERSQKVLQHAGQQVGEHDRKLLLELQSGFVDCARGHALRWQTELSPDDGPLRQQAIQTLSTGIERLTRLEPELKVRLRKPSPKNVAAQDKFTPAEIRGLLLTTAFELGQARFETANLMSTDNPQRLPAIQEAERWLGVALNADRSGETGLSSQVLLAGCARLRIEANRAIRLLDDVAAESPSPAILDQIMAERVRVLLMQMKPVDAAELLTIAFQNRAAPPGELVSLRIQVLIELWQTAEAKQATALAAEFQATIDQQLERVRATNPGYWAAYCESLVTQSRESRTLGADLAEHVRRARGYYSSKQIPAAITAYAQSAKLAKDSGRADVAFDLAYTGGSIEIESGRFSDAIRTFDALVAEQPAHSRTPDAHLLAAHALGQIYSGSATKPNREAYTAKLEAVRRDHPHHPTFGEATWLLARLEEKRLQNSAAIQLYRQIPTSHARGPAAASATARCYDRLLHRLRELRQPTEKWETEAVATLTTLLPEEKSTATLTEDQAVLLLHLSNIVLQSNQPDFAAADRWLEGVTRSAETVNTTNLKAPATGPHDPRQHWQEFNRAAARLRVVSLAGQGKFPEAEKMLASIAATSPSELLSIIDGLSKLVAHAQEKPLHHLGELQLRAALNLKARQHQLEPADRQRLDRCVAEAYVAAGRYQQALEPFGELLQSNPRDPGLLTSYAQLLMKFGLRARTAEAQAVWKRLESGCKSGSADWFEARYQFARCDLELGSPDKALKLIGVTKVLYPQLGGPEIQQKFLSLQEACQKRK